MSALRALPPDDPSIAEANHRIANNLSMLAAYARLEATGVRERPMLTGAECAAMLEEVAARVHTIAQLHRLLTQSTQTIDGPAYLAEVCAYATDSSVSEGLIRFSTSFEPGLTLPQEQLGAVGMILVEGVINATKYAHPAIGVVGLVSAGGRREANGDVVLEVRDDGVGLPEGFCPKAHGGVGLRMMQSLASHIPADLSFRSTPLGLTVRLRLSV
jgi:two-component sensor histidine kinase